MLFNSLQFLIFLPVVITAYYVLPHKYRWILLFLASSYFYMAFIPEYIFILYSIILIDYFSAILIEKQDTRQRKKKFLYLSLLANISVLVFFKYFNFFNNNMTSMLGFFDVNNAIRNRNIILPIGLSFHTFQSIAYTVEVYRENQKAEKHIGYFANYVLFFPQLVAGPIERYDRLGNQLHQAQKLLYENLSKGFQLILYGLFIKMVIADNLAPYVNSIYKDPIQYNSLSIVTGILFFSLEIYADFYGYSLIAMGSAKMMGIDLMANFRNPYFSRNIYEFWQRWHISLTSWFRDYVYIPLGGNRVKKNKWVVNILLVFILSGLWHGASWTFIIWGLLHGLLYVFYLFVFKNNQQQEMEFNLSTTLKVVSTFFLVSILWVFFRAESIDQVFSIYRSFINNINLADNFSVDIKIWFLLLLFLFTELLWQNKTIDQWLSLRPVTVRWSIYSVLLFCIITLSSIEELAFIYFQF